MLEQLLRQQGDLLREKEGQIALQEKHIAGPISPRERDSCQRGLADMHKQLAELRFAKFKTQKAIKNERVPTPRTDDNSASSSSTSNPPYAGSSPITSVVAPLPVAAVAASPATTTSASGSPRSADRFRGAPQPEQPPHRAQTPPPTPTVIDTTVTWRELLVASGIDEPVAATYQRLWAHIALPADKNQIPFAVLKAFDGVKVRACLCLCVAFFSFLLLRQLSSQKHVER